MTNEDIKQATKCHMCEHYRKYRPKERCDAPIEVNEKCMEEFNKWKRDYIIKWASLMG